jgi:inosose dehydratase
VHIKDVELRVLEQAKADQRTDFDEWWAGVCTPLGSGDVDVDGFISDLVGSGYDGWLVVEQDRRPTAPHEYSAVAQQQAENRQWLSEIVVRHAGGDA